MGTVGAACAGDFQGLNGSGGDNVGKDGTHPEREGGVQGHWASRGVVEGLLSYGSLSAEKEYRAAQHDSWIQRRERDGDGNAGGISRTASGGSYARASLPGISRYLKYL